MDAMVKLYPISRKEDLATKEDLKDLEIRCNFSKSPGNLPIIANMLLRRAR
jgi:hypothetical protein